LTGAATRIAHYNNRMTSSQIDPVLAAKHTVQKANFASYAIEWYALAVAVHNYLNSEGVLPYEYFNYDGFAGEIYHISKHFAGAAAVITANDFVVKYSLYGCTAVRLKAIAALFGIIVP